MYLMYFILTYPLILVTANIAQVVIESLMHIVDFGKISILSNASLLRGNTIVVPLLDW